MSNQNLQDTAIDARVKSLQEIIRENFEIQVEVLEGGHLPVKKNKTDAGWDLIATEDLALYPGQVLKHPLNLRMRLPQGTWAEIATKSGLGSKGQLVYAGVIDEEYRGVPHVVMTNVKHTNEDGTPNQQPLVIKKGEKLAQLIMNPYSPSYYITEVKEIDTNTSRGEGGFGSTGK